MERCVRLRPGLEIIRTGPRSFVLSDPRTGTVFELGAEERYLLHLLEQAESLDDILRGFEGRFGRRMARREVLEFLEQLRQLGLLAGGTDAAEVPVATRPPELPAPVPAPPSPADPGARLNLFFDLLA